MRFRFSSAFKSQSLVEFARGVRFQREQGDRNARVRRASALDNRRGFT
jgi:hypothetical protein